MINVSFVDQFSLDFSIFVTLMILFVSSDYMYKIRGSSAGKFFALCSRNQKLSSSSKLLSGKIFSASNSSLAYLCFFYYFITSSTFSEVTSVILNGRGWSSTFSSFSGFLAILVQPVFCCIKLYYFAERLN